MDEYYDMYSANEIEDLIYPEGKGWSETKKNEGYDLCGYCGYETYMAQFVRVNMRRGVKEHVEVCQNCGLTFFVSEKPWRKKVKQSPGAPQSAPSAGQVSAAVGESKQDAAGASTPTAPNEK